jgi:hypothetical protein
MASRTAARLLLLALLMAVPAAAQVEGRYELTRIDGRALPRTSPTEEGVAVKRGSLSLGLDGRFELSMTADTESGERSERIAGTYATVRDTIRFTIDAESRPVMVYQWRRMRDTLTLLDLGHHEYDWVREPMPVAGDPWAPGTWAAVQLNGRTLPAPWPLGEEVTVNEWTFAFGEDGRLTMRWISDMRGAEEAEDTVPYRIEGEKLLVLHDDGTVDDEYVWMLRDGQLRLVDDTGNVYLLARR